MCLYLCIVVCFVVGVRVHLMDVVCFDSQTLFNIQSQAQCFDFGQFQWGFDAVAAQIEIMSAATFGDVLDQADATVPCCIRQSFECLFEAGAIVYIGAEVDGQQHMIEWTDDLVVGIGLQMVHMWFESRVCGITIDQKLGCDAFSYDEIEAIAASQRKEMHKTKGKTRN